MGKTSRAEHAGRRMGEAITEMVHLMYQANTAQNFYNGLMAVIDEQGNERPCFTCVRKGLCERYSTALLSCDMELTIPLTKAMGD